MTSETAIRPALASCRRTPPDSSKQQHGGGTLARRAFEQPDQLGAVHLADGAAHEAAFLRGDQHGASVERAAADDHAVVEGGGQIERVRCGLTTRASAAGFRGTTAGSRTAPTRSRAEAS